MQNKQLVITPVGPARRVCIEEIAIAAFFDITTRLLVSTILNKFIHSSMFSIAVCCAVASGAATTPPRWHELNATYSYAEYIDHFGNGKAQVGSTTCSSPFPLQPLDQ